MQYVQFLVSEASTAVPLLRGKRTLDTSAAAPERTSIEMEMVVMGGVEIGAERDAEIPAAPGLYGTQEAAGGVVTLPVALDGDAAAVGQLENGDVESVRGGVLTAIPER